VPTLLGDFFSRKSSGGAAAGASVFSPLDGTSSNVASAVSKAKVTLNSPDDQRQTYVMPDPIKLVNAVPCDWKISDLKADVTEHMEAKPYWGMLLKEFEFRVCVQRAGQGDYLHRSSNAGSDGPVSG